MEQARSAMDTAFRAKSGKPHSPATDISISGDRATMAKNHIIGMLGAGFIGSFHSFALRMQELIKTPPKRDITLKLITDLNEATRRAVQKRFKWQQTETDWHAIIADPDINIFVNAGPNNLHSEPSTLALKAGKHVFCEKPLAEDAEKAFDMWNAASASKLMHQAAFVYRFVPAVRHMRDLIKSGKIGDVTAFRSNYLMNNYLQKDLAFSWRLDKKVAGSGTFGDLGAHHIDAARFLVGEVAEVGALARIAVPEVGGKKVEVDDGFVSILQFESGVIGSIESSRVAAGYQHTSRFQVDGTKGSLRFDVARLNELEIADDLSSGFRTIQVIHENQPFSDFWWEGGVQGSHPIGWVECFVHQMRHFLGAVEGEHAVSPYAATFEDGYRTAEIGDTMIKSWKSGKREKLNYRAVRR
jgi:predicted dehydrogenase